MFKICILILALLVAGNNDALAADKKSKAKGKRVTIVGKLDVDQADDYSIATIQNDGKSTLAKISQNKKFRIKLNAIAANNASIHLVSGAGRYLGPVVVPAGDQAATRLSGKNSGNLGELKISDGFISASKGKNVFSRKDSVDFDPVNGTPGSGNLGLVKAAGSVMRLAAKADDGKDDSDKDDDKDDDSESPDDIRPGDDLDNDGIPNLVDVDDDGDLILDSADSDFQGFAGPKPYLFSDLVGDAVKAVNANAQNVTAAMIDEFIKSNLNVVFGYNSATLGEIVSGNVDCFGLPYCGTGGVGVIEGLGEISLPEGFPTGSLWSTYDTDSDGLPNLYIYPSKTRAEIIIKPSVALSQIGAGDSILFKMKFEKKTETYPLVLSFVFATVPSITTVSHGTTVVPFTYPSTDGVAGSAGNPINLTSTDVSLVFWRPQRPGIPGAEDSTLVDMGNLRYGVDVAVNNGDSSPVVKCTADDFSNLSPTLTKVASQLGDDIDVLKDLRADSAPNSAETLSFTLNLASCLARAGISINGQNVVFGVTARDQANNNAHQRLNFKLP